MCISKRRKVWTFALINHSMAHKIKCLCYITENKVINQTDISMLEIQNDYMTVSRMMWISCVIIIKMF